MTVYAFGLEEHTYTSNGTHSGDLYYYTLAGRLLGTLDGSGNTVFDLTDTLGSVMASFSNTDKSAAINGNQVFGPYGNYGYHQGTINTTKGFTGQYNDSLTGLDYYGSRYYDQMAGVFLSADVVQGNMLAPFPQKALASDVDALYSWWANDSCQRGCCGQHNFRQAFSESGHSPG
jgi:RHS repeat-associated protein